MLHRLRQFLLIFALLWHGLGAGTGEYSWTFAIETNQWSNTTTSDVWTLSGYTFTKAGGSNTPSGGFSEVWEFNPTNTRWQETSTSSQEWQQTAPGTWTEHVVNNTWKWSAPTSGQPRGTWSLNGTGPAWTYNETDQIWNETGTSNTKFFPPYLPPQVVVQHQEILDAYDHLTTREIPDGTTDISWTDGYETLTYDYTDGTWTFELPDHTMTYDDTPEWKDDIAIDGGTAYTERWTVAENVDPTLGRTFTHASSGVVSAETIHYNACSNIWTYNNHFLQPWQFDPVTNDWVSGINQARYQYDTRYKKWIQADKGTPLRVWQAKKDETDGWVWNDVIDDVNWQHDSGAWENLATSDAYFPTGSNSQLQDNSGNLWTYSPAAWTKSGTSDTAHLFPLLPPNPAGQLGRIQQQGYLLAQSHLASETSFKSDYDTYQASFDAAIAQRGSARVSGVTPLETPASDLAASITPWQTTYQQLAYPHHTATHVFAPITGAAVFYTWNHVGWRFPQTGKGVVYFKAKGASKMFLALSPTPRTSSTGYVLLLQDTPTTALISSHSGFDSGDIAIQTTIETFIPDGDTWYDYWLSYNNGEIKLGTGAMVNKNSVYSIDITGETDADQIQYFSFSSYNSGSPFEFKDVRSVPYDQAVAFAGATDIALRASDEIAIGTWQATYDTHKTKLNDIANVITTSERKTELDEVKTSLATAATEVATTKTATDTNGYGAANALDAEASRADFDDIHDEITKAHRIATDYASIIPHVTTIENEVIDLFLEIQENPTLSSFTSSRDTVATTITTSVDALITALTTLHSEAVALQALPGSSGLTPLVNTLKEELAIAKVQKLAIPYFKERIILKYYQGNPDTDEAVHAANIARATTASNTARSALIATLATQLAASDLTLYATVVGTISLTVKNTMGQVRSETSSLLSANSLLNDFPSMGHEYATASSNETVISDNLVAVQTELETTVTPLVLTQDPGTDKPAQPSVETLVSEGKVDETVDGSSTTDVTDQDVQTSAGTDEDPTVAVVTDGATVQELTVDTTDKTETHLQIRAKDSTVSIGRSDLTKESGKSVTVLGSASLIPDGEGVIYLSSDVHILANDDTSNESTPIQAGPDFGKATTDTRCVGSLRLAEKGKHKLEFRATGRPQSIVLGKGVELNLTNFGKGDTPGGQRIVFGDNVSLVLRPGASIRFPYLEPNNANRAPVLEFAGENARLIFEDPQNRDENRWTNTKDGSDKHRNKLLGTGFIRFSGKQSRMEILRGALVGCEGDYTSPRTDIRIELTGERARLEIGNESIAGGAFQIGNFQDGGYNRNDTDNYPNNGTHPLFGDSEAPFEPRTQQIDFSLTVNGPHAELHINREGFLGFGVGVVNKSGEPNGDTPNAETDPTTDPNGVDYNAWRVQALHNVGTIQISILNGSLNHHSFGIGNEKDASLLAIGPINSLGAYQFQFNKALPAPIKGGGNVMYMHKLDAGVLTEGTPLPLRIWSTMTNTITGTSADNGKHSLLACAPAITGRKVADLVNAGSYTFGAGSVTDASNIFTFVGNASDLYRLITMRSYTSDQFYVPVKRDGTALTIPYINNSNVLSFRSVQPRDVLTPTGSVVALEKVGINGYIEGRDGNLPPQRFTQK